MSCTDAKGKVIWNQTYEMQDPMVRTCSNVVAVGDYNGRNIYVSDTAGNLGTMTQQCQSEISAWLLMG